MEMSHDQGAKSERKKTNKFPNSQMAHNKSKHRNACNALTATGQLNLSEILVASPTSYKKGVSAD